MRFEVDRATWWRGQGASASYLRRTDGKRVIETFPDLDPTVLVNYGQGQLWMIAMINDDKLLGEATREKKLKELFAMRGDEIVFVGEGNPADLMTAGTRKDLVGPHHPAIGDRRPDGDCLRCGAEKFEEYGVVTAALYATMEIWRPVKHEPEDCIEHLNDRIFQLTARLDSMESRLSSLTQEVRRI